MPPRFSDSEYRRRRELVRRWLADSGFDAVLIYANTYGGDNVRWLTGFPPRHDTYLIWPREGEPALLTQLFNHIPNARRVSVVADTRWGGEESGAAAAGVLRERSVTRGRVGLVGRVPYTDHARLTERLPDVDWVGAGKGYLSLRLVKSEEEIGWLRRGAEFTDAAMAALAEAAAPGVSEHELAAAIESAYTRAGGEHGIHFLGSTPMDAPQSYVPAQTQTARRLQAGDAVICELSAGAGGYAGQIHRLITVGREPTKLYRRLYDVALKAYERIASALRAGATVKDVLDAGDFIAAEGLTVCDDLLHGYGMGYLPPVIRTRATAHRDQAPEDFVFQKNMAVVVQPNVCDPASGAGLQLGNLLVVGENGAESLQEFPMVCVVK